MKIRLHTPSLLAVALLLAACADRPLRSDIAGDAVDVVLLGELHDDPAHAKQHLAVVQSLAARGRLAGLALEMAEQGGTTAGLPRHADAAAVRAALRWNDQAWPWTRYGPAVMAAVAAGVPVLGANLPRERMRPAMSEEALDQLLDPEALQAQREAIRSGHCNLLPPQQLAPMARIQIARDRSMARVIAGTARPGQVVVLLAGAGHVDPQLGVPRHLPAGLRVQPQVLPRSAPPATDHCEDLRRQLQRPASR